MARYLPLPCLSLALHPIEAWTHVSVAIIDNIVGLLRPVLKYRRSMTVVTLVSLLVISETVLSL